MATSPWRVNESSSPKEIAIIPNNGHLNPSPREMTEARNLLKIQEEAAHYSFQPKLTFRPDDRNTTKVVILNRWDHLYKDAMERKVLNLSRTGEIHSFKPTISKKANLIVRDRKSFESHFLAVGSGRLSRREEVKESFIPTVNKRPNSDDKVSPTNASERLYASRDNHKLNNEKKIAELEEKVALECPFSPTISPRMKNCGEQSTDNPKVSVEDRLLSLGQRSHEKRVAEIRERNEKSMVGATFQPSFFSPQKSLMRSRSADSTPYAIADHNGEIGDSKVPSGNRFDTLYQDAVKRQANELSERFDKTDLTFQPSISALASKRSTARKSSEMIDCLHNAIGAGRVLSIPKQQDENTYTPIINKSNQTSKKSVSAGSVSDRLYNAKDIHKMKLDTLKLTAAIKMAEECTFAPEISEKSRNSASSEDSVVDRLLEYGEVKKKKLSLETGARTDTNNLHVTFSPKISECPRQSESDNVDRFYADTTKIQTENPLMLSRIRSKENNLLVSSDLVNTMNQVPPKEIDSSQAEVNMKKEESQNQEVIGLDENDYSDALTLSSDTSSVEKSQLDSIGSHQAKTELQEKRRNEIIQARDIEKSFTPPKVIPCKKLNSPRGSMIGEIILSPPESPVPNPRSETHSEFRIDLESLLKVDIVPPYKDMDKDITDVEIVESPTVSSNSTVYSNIVSSCSDTPESFPSPSKYHSDNNSEFVADYEDTIENFSSPSKYHSDNNSEFVMDYEDTIENFSSPSKYHSDNNSEFVIDYSKSIPLVFDDISGDMLQLQLTGAARD